MKNNNGFSLVELLVSIIIASILVLTVGVLSSVANSSFNRLNSEQQIYNDLSYGFKLLQYKVRGSSSIATGNRASPWISGKHFLIDGGAFGLYQSSSTETDLVYDNGTQIEKILLVPQPGSVNLSFPVAITSQAVTVRVSGAKNNVSFDMQTTIARRNQ